MASRDFDLHPDRLSTTDDRGKRIFVHPADVVGFFRRQRTRVQAVLIVFFLALPWVKINGRQAFLLDIAHRQFEIFGLSLRAHNAPLLIFVFAAAAFALFFATAVFGRVWCGWACPQTVFIDGVFRRIERWTEGSAAERRHLDKAPWSVAKLRKRSLKWVLYLIATVVLTHSFLAYFVGTETLAKMLQRSPAENWGSFLFMAISSGIILFDFAWFREQFCTIVCPYGRFQSVLMDKSSLVIAYDTARGEPRAKLNEAKTGEKQGDCINCYRCVQVCPTGIDIRRGTQMECIACTACIDACDDIMTKVHRPLGLIRYSTEEELSAATVQKTGRFNARAAIYLALCLSAVVALLVSLARIKPIDIAVLRAKDTPYTTQTLDDGSVIVVNHFKLELSNQSGATHSLQFAVSGDLTNANVQLITAQNPLVIEDGRVTQTDIFIRFPKSLLHDGQTKLGMMVRDTNSQSAETVEISKELTVVGPFI